jgi:peptidoglycan/LPS O-acetylase OafA/YrhL
MTGWFSRRLGPGAPQEPGRDLALEGMRGLCACLVLYGHMTIPQARLDPGYAPPWCLWWLNLGSTAVLFFFVLSGYVIGLSVRSPFSGGGAAGYLGRRLLRLAPVNTAAVFLSWLFIPRVAHMTIYGNLLFLQNFKPYPFRLYPFLNYIAVMPDNENLWSLNFEALYYVAFLAVWWLAPSLGSFLLVAALGTLAASVSLGSHVLGSAYMFGALYWFAGLAVAWLAPKDAFRGNWPSALLALLVMWPLAPLQRLLYSVNLGDPMYPLPIPALHRLDQLPVVLWVLLAVTGRGAALRKWLGPTSLAMASAALVFVAMHPGLLDQGAVILYGAAILAGWILLGWGPQTRALAALAPVGAISFGIYAVGFPIGYSIFKSPFLPSGTAMTYTLRVLVLVVLTFGIAWILERKLQPAVRDFFRKRPANKQPIGA